MKKLWLALLLTLPLALGCQESSPEAKRANDRAKKEVGEAADASAEALRQQREEYRKKINTDLERLDDQLKTWKEKANQAKGDARVRMQKQVADLEVKRDKLRERVKDLKADSKNAWEEMKTGIDKAATDLQGAFDKAKDEFK